MKKLIFSGVLFVALICSTSAMAQDVNKKKEPAKQKTEVKAVESKESTTTKKELKKDEKKVEEKKAAPVKIEKGTKQTSTTSKAK